MKKWIIIGIMALALLGTIGVLSHKLSVTTDNWLRSENNYKAAEADRAGEKRIYQLTLAQVMNSNDSLAKHAVELARQNGIKDKRITALQYQISTLSKRDTVRFRDTIFLDPKLHLDTLIQNDKWYSLQLGLRYPNEIITEPTFNNENYVIFDSRKETVNPRKKFFLARWFQKKQLVQEVQVFEENPYAKKKEQRFINIQQ